MSETRCPSCQSPSLLGVEISEVYDGVLFWVCESCNTAFQRFDSDDRRHRHAAGYIETHNRAATCNAQLRKSDSVSIAVSPGDDRGGT